MEEDVIVGREIEETGLVLLMKNGSITVRRGADYGKYLWTKRAL